MGDEVQWAWFYLCFLKIFCCTGQKEADLCRNEDVVLHSCLSTEEDGEIGVVWLGGLEHLWSGQGCCGHYSTVQTTHSGIATVGPGRACALPIILSRTAQCAAVCGLRNYVSSRSRLRRFSLLPRTRGTQQRCLLPGMRSQNSKFFSGNMPPEPALFGNPLRARPREVCMSICYDVPYHRPSPGYATATQS